MRLGERDNERFDNSRSEVALMGEISRAERSTGQLRPDAVRPAARAVRAPSSASPRRRTTPGADVRPQTTARGVGVLFGLETRTPFDKSPSWQRAARRGQRPQVADVARRVRSARR